LRVRYAAIRAKLPAADEIPFAIIGRGAIIKARIFFVDNKFCYNAFHIRRPQSPFIVSHVKAESESAETSLSVVKPFS
jgi:hypothetical protein